MFILTTETLTPRFDPTFVLPITDPVQLDSDTSSTPTTKTPGRRTGTGSAAISNSATFASKNRQPTPHAKILGFKVVSLWSMISHTGRIPTQTSNKEKYESLEDVRKRAHGPIVVFPECTTSNGRGLLRFADVFKHERDIPVKGYKIFLMCIRWCSTLRPASERQVTIFLDMIRPRASPHPSATRSPRTC